MKKSRLLTFGRHLDEKYSECGKCMNFTGTVQEILLELHNPSLSAYALHPSRILRSVLEYKINYSLQNPSSFVQGITNKVLEYYQNDSLSELESYISSVCPELLSFQIHQPFDSATWESSTVNRNEKTTEMLVDSKERDEHIGFIPLGHGGLTSGIEVYLDFVEQTHSRESFFYPVRFSRLKKHDVHPVLTNEEKEYLRGKFSSVTPALFDEDISSGKTLADAFLYFRNEIFDSLSSPSNSLKDKSVLILSNRGEKCYRVRKPSEWESLYTEYNL